MTRVVDGAVDEDEVVEVDVEGEVTITTVVVGIVLVEVEEEVEDVLVGVWEGVIIAVELRTPFRDTLAYLFGRRKGEVVTGLTSNTLTDISGYTAPAPKLTPARCVPCRAPGNRPSAR